MPLCPFAKNYWKIAIFTPFWICPAVHSKVLVAKTVVLFFEKGAPTRKVWFYKLEPGRNIGKTNPLNDDDLKEFVASQSRFADSERSWTVDAKNIDPVTFDLSIKNPNKPDEAELP